MLRTTKERWRKVVRLKVRGEQGHMPDDEEVARRAGYRVRTLDHLYARSEFREMLRAEEERVREEIRRTAAARLLHALRNPGDKDDGAKLAVTVWDKSRRDGEENGCGLARRSPGGEGGCETNGETEAEARLERLTDRELAALAALATKSEPGGAARPGEGGP